MGIGIIREAVSLWRPEGMKFHKNVSHEHRIKDAALASLDALEESLDQITRIRMEDPAELVDELRSIANAALEGRRIRTGGGGTQ